MFLFILTRSPVFILYTQAYPASLTFGLIIGWGCREFPAISSSSSAIPGAFSANAIISSKTLGSRIADKFILSPTIAILPLPLLYFATDAIRRPLRLILFQSWASRRAKG